MDSKAPICIVFLFLVAQLSLLKSGECYQFATTYPGKSDYVPGETFTFGCRGTLQQGDVFQFLKLGSPIVELNGIAKVGYTENSTVLATFGELDPALTDVEDSSDPLLLNIADRYSVEGSHDATSFDYTFTITNIQLEDHGNLSCTVVRQDGGGSKPSVPLRVLGPITEMAIVHHVRGDDRSEIKNYPEIENEDGVLTYNVTDPGYLMCIVETSTTPLIFWEMMLYDPYTKNTTNVTDKFSTEYREGVSTTFGGGLFRHRSRIHFAVGSPILFGRPEDISYMDYGKTLTFNAKVENYDIQEVSTILDIQFAPRGTYCALRRLQAPIATKNFTLLCYTVSNPVDDFTWTVNDEQPRQGVSVKHTKEGPYFVSRLIFDEVQESDFGQYAFTVENAFGGDSVNIQFTKGEEVFGLDEAILDFPWDKKKRDTSNGYVSKASTLVCASMLIVLHLIACH